METTELVRYRRSLKRKNYSLHTVKSYMSILDQCKATGSGLHSCYFPTFFE